MKPKNDLIDITHYSFIADITHLIKEVETVFRTKRGPEPMQTEYNNNINHSLITTSCHLRTHKCINHAGNT